jgi:hypothetical protein
MFHSSDTYVFTHLLPDSPRTRKLPAAAPKAAAAAAAALQASWGVIVRHRCGSDVYNICMRQRIADDKGSNVQNICTECMRQRIPFQKTSPNACCAKAYAVCAISRDSWAPSCPRIAMWLACIPDSHAFARTYGIPEEEEAAAAATSFSPRPPFWIGLAPE